MSSRAPGRPPASEAVARKQEILDLGTELYLQGSDFAVTEIAEKLGIAESGIRYYFQSRAGLIRAVEDNLSIDPLLVELVGERAAAMSLSLWRQLGTQEVHVKDATPVGQDAFLRPVWKLTVQCGIEGDITMRAAWDGDNLTPPIEKAQADSLEAGRGGE